MIFIDLDARAAVLEIEGIEKRHKQAFRSGMKRIGQWVEDEAEKNAPKNFGRLSKKVRSRASERGSLIVVAVVSYTDYSLFVEQGFQGHFVPFHVSEDLYRTARIKWGWRVPPPEKLLDAKSGRRYLIPRGRKNPVWGVFIPGRAQPFLRPALEKLYNTKTWLRIMRQEYRKVGLGA